MELQDALDEVLDAAKRPKQYPAGAKAIAVTNEAIVGAGYSGPLKTRAFHESLSPAQETVCRWIWETCANHRVHWEKFEFGFLCDYNVDHELAMWARIALIFAEFVKRHPSVNKRIVVQELCALSAGAQVTVLKAGRAKELTDPWKQQVKG
jgi:hypothetical protein